MNEPHKPHVTKHFGFVGFAERPSGWSERDAKHPLVRSMHGALDALLALDKTMSENGDITRPHTRVQIELAKAKHERKAMADALARAEAKRYAVPKASDPALDAELRSWYHGLPAEKRGKEFADNAQLRAALARFPGGDFDAERARALHREEVDQRDPQGVRELERQRNALGWADSAVSHLDRKLDDAAVRQVLPYVFNADLVKG